MVVKKLDEKIRFKKRFERRTDTNAGEEETHLMIREDRSFAPNEANWLRKNKSREEALLGKCVVFGAKSHHIILNFWENTLNYGSCNKKTRKPPRKPLFLMISDKY